MPSRSKRVLFVAHCILNQNSRVQEAAVERGMLMPVVSILHQEGVGMIQMPCPEFTYLGPNRWWQAKAQYDTPNYRRHCRELSTLIVDQMEEYVKHSYSVLGIIGMEGSPSCGINNAGPVVEWGGRPQVKLSEAPKESGKGVFMEEVIYEVRRRGLELPRLRGLDVGNEDYASDEELARLRRWLIEA
jgi:predicted secreted protein